MLMSNTEKPPPRRLKTIASPTVRARFVRCCDLLGVPHETKLRELVHRFVIEEEAKMIQREAHAKTSDTP
jgi:hypothetical protein